jgi:leader peptidase (prepilin peptidase) / N-methyltransferase
MRIMLIAWTALLGMVVGSFLNVCIYRIPRQESVAFPASHCPACGTPIRAWDNIPLLSFLLLRGRCRACRAPIAWRYPLVEALTGTLFAATVDCWGVTWQSLSLLLLLSALVAVTFIDLDHQIIPNVITLPGIPIGLLAGLLAGEPSMLDRILGTLIGAGFLYLVLYYGSVFYGQDAMGEGDLNLLAMIGAFLGWRAVLVTVLVSCLSGSLVGLALIGTKRLSRREPLPFGPFLCLGAVVALFAGESLIAWYLQRLH